MTLNTNETIDATSKGNRSRFLNHCCDPNCVTQKWLVDGMERIGVFTKANVAQGTELTYNYFGDMGSDNHKFFGSVKQPCFCGSPRCGKWLGAKPIRLPGDDELDAANALVEEPKKRKLVEKETSEQRFLRVSEAFLGDVDLSTPNGSFPTGKRMRPESLEMPADAAEASPLKEASVKADVDAKPVKPKKGASKPSGKTVTNEPSTTQVPSIPTKTEPATIPLFLRRNLAICKPVTYNMMRNLLESLDRQANSELSVDIPGIFERGGRLVHLAVALGQVVDERDLVPRSRRTRASARQV